MTSLLSHLLLPGSYCPSCPGIFCGAARDLWELESTLVVQVVPGPSEGKVRDTRNPSEWTCSPTFVTVFGVRGLPYPWETCILERGHRRTEEGPKGEVVTSRWVGIRPSGRRESVSGRQVGVVETAGETSGRRGPTTTEDPDIVHSLGTEGWVEIGTRGFGRDVTSSPRKGSVRERGLGVPRDRRRALSVRRSRR